MVSSRSFVGQRRGYEEGAQKERLPIDGLFYEAYESMALKKMRQIIGFNDGDSILAPGLFVQQSFLFDMNFYSV